MKYKKHIATGALAISLLVGGTNVYASSPQDLGIKSIQKTFQKDHRGSMDSKIRSKRRGGIVGTISALNSSGFTLDVKNMRTKATYSIDVKVDAGTVYKKNGLGATAGDLVIGSKVIILGDLDKTTNILTAKTVKIVTGGIGMHENKKKLD